MGKGANSLYIQASSGSIISDKIYVEDNYYFNGGTSLNGLNIDNGVSVTVEDESLKITTSTYGEKYVKIPVDSLTNWEYSFQVAKRGISCDWQWIINSNNSYGNQGMVRFNLGGYDYFTPTDPIVNGIMKIQCVNGVTSAYFNDVLITSKNTQNTLTNCGFYINPNRTQYIKNIKIKQL